MGKNGPREALVGKNRQRTAKMGRNGQKWAGIGKVQKDRAERSLFGA